MPETKDISALLTGRVKAFCKACGLGSRPVAVALSGGADSVALLLLLVDAGIMPRALHCNFHLRGAESDRDCRFCTDLCAGLGLDIEVRHFDVSARMKATGESVEMACRELRYAWWHSLKEDVAVAHHADDNAETLMLNLLRGSGVRGLKGMLPRRGNIVRPLLSSTRAEILEYLALRGQGYVTDSTNLQSDYRRNFLRNEVFPLLEKAFPGARASIARSIECLRSDYDLLSFQEFDLENRFADPFTGAVDIAALSLEYSLTEPALYALLRRRGFNMARTREMIRAAESRSTGASWTADTGVRYVLTKEGLLAPVSGATRSWREGPVDLSQPPLATRTVSRVEFERLVAERSPRRIFLDADALGPSPQFCLRTWRDGDRLKPFGMKGSRLVSDIYSDAGIGAASRSEYPLLTLGPDILWVAGLRASRHYAVGPTTKRILLIEYQP